MPGLTGLATSGPAVEGERDTALTPMLDALVPAPWLERSRAVIGGFASEVSGHPNSFGQAAHDGAVLVYEGWPEIRDAPDETGDVLAERLLASYRRHGARFAEALGGFFQIAIHDHGKTLLVADPLATRRLFYAVHPTTRELLFSTEMPAIFARLGRTAPDLANLAHFLISGRFFAGQTALQAVRLLLPGESVVYEGGTLRREPYTRYVVEPRRDVDPDEALTELEERVDRAVLRAWRRSANPAFLLSGGYDSRYLLYSVLERAGVVSHDLRTVIWGARLDLPYSDTWISGRIAQSLGTRHVALRWSAEAVAEQFDPLFAAQSGMTDVCMTHVDERIHCDHLRRDHGIGSLFRGDEIFGPKGEEVRTLDDVLRRLAWARASEVAGSASWFGDDPTALEAHDAELERWIATAPQTLPELRDTLYAVERLPALQNQLTSHRAHYLETVNPLLDPDIVRFYRTLPSTLRTGKRLFIHSFETRFRRHLDIPIATEDNSVDWSREAAVQPSLRDFLSRELATLPRPFNRATFTHLHETLIAAGGGLPARPSYASEGVTLPTVRLVFRAVVLGRWLRDWSTV